MMQPVMSRPVRTRMVRRRATLPWPRRGLGAHRQQDEAPDSHRLRRPSRNDLAAAPVSISVEYTVPGSPQDERLCREQARAVLELLSDIVKRRGDRAA
jgi:hypothetical protein